MTAMPLWLVFAGGFVIGALSFPVAVWWLIRDVEKEAMKPTNTKRGDELLQDNE